MEPLSEPIRVLRVIARLNVGGPALHVSYLSHELDALGYETLLVAGRVGPGEGSMEYVADDLHVRRAYVPELQREIDPLGDASTVRRLRRLIDEFRPHILHTHTAKAGAVGRTAALLAGPSRPPVVVHTFHGHVLRGYFGDWKTTAFRRLEYALARASDALVVVSPEVRDDLVALGVAPAKKIAVIRLGLDLEQRVLADAGARARTRQELALPDDAFVVGWLGRMTEIKRVDDLLRAVAPLDPRVHLLLVGDGPLRGELERLAHDLGIWGRCRFAGYRQDVAPLYAACDAVALTSANEGTPVTVIEALAAGLPAVATRVGGVPDVVRDGHSGFLVDAGDVEGFGAALARLENDAELRRRFGEQGRADVVPRYSVPRLVRDVDLLYRSLLPQREKRVVAITAPLTRTSPRRRVAPAPRRLRVVLVSQYFPPEIGATQSRIQSFAEHLSDRGHRVTVIAEFPNHPHGVIPPAYDGRLIEDDRSNDYRVLRVWVKTNQEKTQMTRLEFYLSFMSLATAVAPLAGRADVVVATTPPLFTGLAGWAISKLNRAPFVLDVRDLWPAAATSLRQISPGFPTRAAELVERRLYRSADEVVAVTRPFCDHIDSIRSRFPRTVLIPNGTLEAFFAADGSDRLGVPAGKFLVTFAGTHGIAQALPAILDAAAATNGDAEFAFVGEGPMKDIVVGQAGERELANVTFHSQLPLNEILPVLAGSDALLVPLSSHPTFDQFIPSKLIDFMATGKPVVLSARGEAARIVEQARAGLVVPPEDPQRLADAVRWLASHRDEAAEMGLRGREFARRRLRTVQAERLEEVLFDATARRTARTNASMLGS